MSDLNIYQRINAVMAKVSYVQKNTQVSGGGANYKAVTRDAVVSILREELVKAGIVVETSQISGEWCYMRDVNAKPEPVKMGLYKGMYEVRFINADSPEDRAVIQIEAHANDNGDKAPGKAATYAEKTGLLKQFLLETGLNDEERMGLGEIVSDEMCDTFGYLIESGEAMELFNFMSQFSPDDPRRKALFDSVPYGKKTKFKEDFLTLMGEANNTFTDWANELSEGIESEDETVLFEYWDELDRPKKQKIWGRLSEEDQAFLKNRKNQE